MDIFDLYPIKNNNDDFIILDALRKLLKKKKKIKNKKFSIKEKIPINNEHSVEELLVKVKMMKSIDDVNILKILIKKYIPLCIIELEEYNKILLSLGPPLDILVDDILIDTNDINNEIKLILLTSCSVDELHKIINNMEKNLIAIIDNYVLLDG